ncbi:MAG: hypothetical protein HXY46_07410 [Syntrophaceae bacterium]|nr:hypothetical protein [Syntrophaceae bacterium]
MRKMACVFGLFLIMASPLSTGAQAPLPSATAQAVTADEVRQFMEEYKARYMKMDIDAFMALFSKEAAENRMLPYDDLREGYRKTFSNSTSIQYNLEIYNIQTYQKSAFVSGRYELIQFLKPNNKKKIFQGDIQWDLIREGGSLKIREISYVRDYSK